VRRMMMLMTVVAMMMVMMAMSIAPAFAAAPSYTCTQPGWVDATNVHPKSVKYYKDYGFTCQKNR